MTISKINVNGTEYDLDVLIDGSSVSTALGNTATVALAGYRGKVFAASTPTAAATAAKVVTVDDTLWSLAVGDMILLTSTNTNTAASATFNVNSSGAKAVKYAGAAIAAPNLDKAGSSSAPQLYIYDGTNWVWLSGTSITANRLANTAKVGDTNQPVYFTANGVPAAISYTIGKSVPSNAVFTDTDTKVTSAANHYTPAKNADSTKSASGATGSAEATVQVVTGIEMDAKGHVTGVISGAATDTDTKVTSVDNHYEPSADNSAELTAAISGTAGAYALNTEYTVLTGVKAQRDAKGHITGLTYTAQKVKDTQNSNTARLKVQDTTNRKIATTENTGNYIQFTGGTNKVTVTDGTNSFDVAITPSIANCVTGSSLTANTIILGNGNSAIKTSSKTIETSLSSTSDDKIPTSKAIATYVTSLMTSVLTYKGTIGSSGATVTALPATHKVGDVYVAATAGTYAGKAVEVGDYIICKTAGTTAADAHWDVINGENLVDNKSASLAAAGSSATLATVDGTNITVTTPSTWTGVAKTGTITKVGNTASGDVTVSSSNNTASYGSAVTVGTVGGVDLKFTMPNDAVTSVSGKTGDVIGEFIHVVSNPTGTAGSETSGSLHTAIWSGTVSEVEDLYTGLMVQYKVPVAGHKRGTVLNINSLGNHPVVLNKNTVHTTHYPVGSVLILIYDADESAAVYINNVSTTLTGCWKIFNYDSNTTYTNVALGQGYATCATAEATVAKAATLGSYALTVGGIVSVKFTYAVPASATLNVNTRGAKAIYYKGAAITAGIILAGDLATFMYNGSQYHLIAIDRQPLITNGSTDLSWGTDVTVGTVNGVNITAKLPANPNTDTSVTSEANHYTPTAASGSELTASLSGTAGTYALNTEYTVLTGVKAQRDSKGHVTGLTYTAQKVKDTNTTYTGYNIAFQNNAGTTVDTYKALTSPNKTLKAGSNVNMTASSNVITISATDTTYSNATTSTAGLMSAADKTKLDNITMSVSNNTLFLTTQATS